MELDGSLDQTAAPVTGTRDDPAIKFLQYGDKQIILAPGQIVMVAPGAMISLCDEEGLSIMSDKDIRLQSGGDILVAAGEEIGVIGVEGVKLKSESASIELDEDVLIEGKEVKTN